jgi:molybdate transport system substrate-binding protein
LHPRSAENQLVGRVRSEFENNHSAMLTATFGPVGVTSELIGNGAPFDVVISSAPRLAELTACGRLSSATIAELGGVPTALAVRSGAPAPEVRSGSALRGVLGRADAIYCPDVASATAGMHLLAVLQRMGLAELLRPRMRLHADGATAMVALAESQDAVPVGCAQLTEILTIAGVKPVGSFPMPFALSTVYGAAVSANATEPELAARFVDLVTGAEGLELRRLLGFEIAVP